MDYPHGHHHHNRRDDDNNNIYPPPPPPFSHDQPPYPPPPHQTYPPPPHQTYPPPPPPSYDGAYPPPSYSNHSSHETHHGYPPYRTPETNFGSEFQTYPPPHHHSYQPHMPGFIGSHFHHGPENQGSSIHDGPGRPGSSIHDGPEMGLGHLANRPTHKMECKLSGGRYAVAIRDGKLVLTHPDHSDLTQHWYKDEKYSTRVKDKEGHPSFMLVNKGTGQAVKHSISCYPVNLAPYKPDVMDESVLWTESRDLGSGFRTIRTVNNVSLVMDAWNADKDHGGIHDGTFVALYEAWKGDNQNQQWRLVRH